MAMVSMLFFGWGWINDLGVVVGDGNNEADTFAVIVAGDVADGNGRGDVGTGDVVSHLWFDQQCQIITHLHLF